MASLILRPVASWGYVASTVPADTPIEDVYKLVNEEVADEDATYFTLAVNGSEALNNVLFKYELPKNVKRITSLNKIYPTWRQKGTGASSTVPARYSDGNSLRGNYWRCGANASTWFSQTKDETEVYDNEGTIDLEAIRELLNEGDFGMLMYYGAAKNVPSLTQIYLELDCEYEEAGTPIYFKENETWEELSGTIYKKTNGIWEEVAPENIPLLEYPIEEVS